MLHSPVFQKTCLFKLPLLLNLLVILQFSLILLSSPSYPHHHSPKSSETSMLPNPKKLFSAIILPKFPAVFEMADHSFLFEIISSLNFSDTIFFGFSSFPVAAFQISGAGFSYSTLYGGSWLRCGSCLFICLSPFSRQFYPFPWFYLFVYTWDLNYRNGRNQ